MAALSTVSALVVLIIACAAGVRATEVRSTFADENPIRQVVSDGLRELETTVLRVIGQTRHARTFARFAHRFLLLCSLYRTHDQLKYVRFMFDFFFFSCLDFNLLNSNLIFG